MNPFHRVPIATWYEDPEFIPKYKHHITDDVITKVFTYEDIDIPRRLLLERLLQHGGNVDATKKRNSLLWMACWHKLPQTVQLLLHYGAGVNHANRDGVTPLMVSLQQLDMDTAQILLNHGADVHSRDQWSVSCVHYATRYIAHEHLVIKTIFEKFGGNPLLQTDNMGSTVFHFCVMHNNVWLLEWLLERYPEGMNIGNKHGDTCLMTSLVYWRNPKILQVLLQWGHCDAWHRNHKGKTALDTVLWSDANSALIPFVTKYMLQRTYMQLWAAIQLQKSAVLSQHLAQHFLCDMHLWEEWVTWMTPTKNINEPI